MCMGEKVLRTTFYPIKMIARCAKKISLFSKIFVGMHSVLYYQVFIKRENSINLILTVLMDADQRESSF